MVIDKDMSEPSPRWLTVFRWAVLGFGVYVMGWVVIGILGSVSVSVVAPLAYLLVALLLAFVVASALLKRGATSEPSTAG